MGNKNAIARRLGEGSEEQVADRSRGEEVKSKTDASAGDHVLGEGELTDEMQGNIRDSSMEPILT